MAFAGVEGKGNVYVVAPTGLFEDDPNLTNKRFPGNPTKSYRSREALRVLGMVENWQGHPKDVIRQMLDSLQELGRRGLDTIED
jgi:rifampin ADP-ribosylating transferase